MSEPVFKMARVARIAQPPNARFQAEGICTVCSLVVPVRVTEKRDTTAHHYPDDLAHAWDEREGFYCRGSGVPPAAFLKAPISLQARATPQEVAVLLDDIVDDLTGHVTAIALQWAPGTPHADVERLSRAWTKTIQAKPVIASSRFRVYAGAAA